MRRVVSFFALSAWMIAALSACDQAQPAPLEGVEPAPDSESLLVEDLALGDVDPGDNKADGWGAATVCKPIPELPRLTAPEIVISLAGATLHLVDRATGFERVYPLGVGALAAPSGEMPKVVADSIAPIVNEIKYATNLFFNKNEKKVEKAIPDLACEALRLKGGYPIEIGVPQ